MGWSKKIPIVFSVIAIIGSGIACYYSYKADSRSERLFQAERISQIQVTPISFEPYFYDGGQMARLKLQVTNYTGFKAFNLKIDASWQNVWIREWIVAAVKGLTKEQKKRALTEKELEELNFYKHTISQNDYNIEPNKYINWVYQGAFDFDRTKKKMIIVRTKWTSENGAQLEKLFHYELVSTQAYGAESWTLIPLDKTFLE